MIGFHTQRTYKLLYDTINVFLERERKERMRKDKAADHRSSSRTTAMPAHTTHKSPDRGRRSHSRDGALRRWSSRTPGTRQTSRTPGGTRRFSRSPGGNDVSTKEPYTWWNLPRAWTFLIAVSGSQPILTEVWSPQGRRFCPDFLEGDCRYEAGCRTIRFQLVSRHQAR